MLEDIFAFVIGVYSGVVVLNIVINFRVFTGYVWGMSLYRYNNRKGNEFADMVKATKDEFEELKEEVNKRNLFGIFDEANDVWHGIVLSFVILIGGIMVCPNYPWIFSTCMWSAMKQGRRYVEYGCVRSPNHHNPDGSGIDHVCDRRTFGKVMQAVWEEIKRQTNPF